MFGLLELQYNAASYIYLAILVVELFAFIDAAVRPPRAFLAADKLTKPGWLIILGLALLVQFLLSGATILQLMGLVAAIVYIVDARPALRAVMRRR